MTLKIKFDPLPRLSTARDTSSLHTASRGLIGVDGIKHGPNKLTGQVTNQSTTGSTTIPSSTQVTSANDRGGALPALV